MNARQQRAQRHREQQCLLHAETIKNLNIDGIKRKIINKYKSLGKIFMLILERGLEDVANNAILIDRTLTQSQVSALPKTISKFHRKDALNEEDKIIWFYNHFLEHDEITKGILAKRYGWPQRAQLRGSNKSPLGERAKLAECSPKKIKKSPMKIKKDTIVDVDEHQNSPWKLAKQQSGSNEVCGKIIEKNKSNIDASPKQNQKMETTEKT